MSSTPTPTSTPPSVDKSDTPEMDGITDLLEALSDSIHDADTFDDAVAALDELTAFLQFVSDSHFTFSFSARAKCFFFF